MMGTMARSSSMVTVLLTVGIVHSFTVDNGMIVDEAGRRRVFHGANVVEKVRVMVECLRTTMGGHTRVPRHDYKHKHKHKHKGVTTQHNTTQHNTTQHNTTPLAY